MGQYTHWLVVAGLVVVLDLAFLVWGRRRKSAATAVPDGLVTAGPEAREPSSQITLPLEGERRSGGERRQHAAAR
jgi:hypothetical protein